MLFHLVLLLWVHCPEFSNALNICDSEWSRRTQEVQFGDLNFYLSPCHERDNMKAQEFCDPDYSACITTLDSGAERPLVRELGMPIRNTIEEGYGLHFKGSPCSEAAESTTLIIRFVCDYGIYEDKVSILENAGLGESSCIFIFLWLSPSACPRNIITSLQSFEACQLHSAESDETVNFNNMLRSNESFVIGSSSSDRNYRLRLCSEVPPDDGCEGSMLCLTDPSGAFISDLGFGYKGPMNWTVVASYDYWMTNITLTYESYEASIHFNFHCTKSNPYISLGSEETTPDNKQRIIFNVFTKQACPVNVTECPLLRNSFNYDLRNLILKDWKLGNMSITLCRPNQNCLHEDEAICSSDGEVSADVQSSEVRIEPLAIEEGKIHLTYHTNKRCGSGNGSISFIFECHSENLGPVLLEVKDTCHYIALWRTPYVCLHLWGDEMDVYEQTGTDKCLFGDLGIDLAPLFNENGDIIVYNPELNTSWALNICGTGLWGGSKGTCGPSSAVCRLDNVPPLKDRLFPSKKSLNGVSIGDNNFVKALQYEGVLILEYSNGKECTSDTSMNHTSQFSFACGAKQTNSKPEYYRNNGTCQDNFIWSTPLTCPPKTISCKIEGPSGTTIDIGTMGGMSMDEPLVVHSDTEIFVMEICRELAGNRFVYDCPQSSAACLIASKNGSEKATLGLGELRNEPYYNATSEEVILDYTMGSLCKGGSHHHTHYSTRIIFKCHWGRKYHTVEYIGRFGCQYRFIIVTDAACPRKRDLSPPKGGCYISENPNFPNEIIDFSQLVDGNSSLSYRDPSGEIFQVNICQSLPGLAPYAAMMRKPDGKEFMLGRKSEMIHVIDQLIFIEYTNGETCTEDPSQNYSVIIRFICPRFDSPVYLLLADRGHCIYIFNIYTTFVCEGQRTQCGVSTYEGYHYDFTSLIKPSDSSYVVDDTWHLNICQSVESCGTLGDASHPVSVCKSPNATYKVLSQALVINKELQLIYETGESCPLDGNRTVSSVINFSCDPHRYPGYPSKKNGSDGCQIEFFFPTALACKNMSMPYIYTSRSCKFHHSGLGRLIDFSKLHPHVLDGGWTLNPCPNNTHCTVCANGSSYGHPHSSQYDFQQEALIIDIRGGNLCNEDSHRSSSRIWFKCDRSLEEGQDKVKLLYESSCYAEFEWTTSFVCIPFEYEDVKVTKVETSTSSSFSNTAIIIIVLVLLPGICAMVLYLKRHKYRRLLQSYRRGGVGSFVKYRRDIDSADFDDSLHSSSFNDEDSEQYKMM